jgi:hypothetical protein
VDIAIIRERIEAGHYLIRSHAVIHALKEGFERKDIVAAILTGMIIEEIDYARASDTDLWQAPCTSGVASHDIRVSGRWDHDPRPQRICMGLSRGWRGRVYARDSG